MSDSVKKVPYLSESLFNKVTNLNLSGKKSIIFTWSRSSTILPIMVGHTFAIYNGKEHISVLVSNQMIGYKLGEFVPTRTFNGHVKVDKKAKR